MAVMIEGEGFEQERWVKPAVVEENLADQKPFRFSWTLVIDNYVKMLAGKWQNGSPFNISSLDELIPYMRFDREFSIVVPDLLRDEYLGILAKMKPAMKRVIEKVDLEELLPDEVRITEPVPGYGDFNMPKDVYGQLKNLKKTSQRALRFGSDVSLAMVMKDAPAYLDFLEKIGPQPTRQSYFSVHCREERVWLRDWQLWMKKVYYARATEDGLFSAENISKYLDAGGVNPPALIADYSEIVTMFQKWAKKAAKKKKFHGRRVARLIEKRNPELIHYG